MSGFLFQFHEPCASSDSGTEENVVAIAPDAEAVDERVAAEWLKRFPSGDRVMRLEVDNVVILYQRASPVPALEAPESNQKDRRDIVAGKYYGGLKVWSCTQDIVQYYAKNDEIKQKANNGGRLLEIGCGQGLPGIAAILLGAQHVTFHDFNLEVLELCTKPNLAANVAPRMLGAHVPTVSFCFGDWSSFNVPDALKYDIILGSDVTFDLVTCRKVAKLLSRVMSKDGVAIIGTKEYYFGTNGGHQEFRDALLSCKSTFGGFAVGIAEKKAGNEMSRVILRICFSDCYVLLCLHAHLFAGAPPSFKPHVCSSNFHKCCQQGLDVLPLRFIGSFVFRNCRISC